MKPSFPPPTPRHTSWSVVIVPFLIIGILLFSAQAALAAPTSEGQPHLTAATILQQGAPACQACHPQEHAAWKDTVHAKAALDPIFKEQFAKSHNQSDCLKCHTTGYDAASGKFTWEGVTCEACHGAYKQGHPAAETMQLPMASETCRVCHQAAFQEWEKSQHALNKIECFDCHQSHDQGLRTGTAEKLCAACHNNQQTQLAHSLHGINNVDCGSCHMTKDMKNSAGASATGASIEAKSHSFAVPANVCNRCHSDTIHPVGALSSPSAAASVVRIAGQAALAPDESNRVGELEGQIDELQARLRSLQDVAVVSMGAALAVGGFVGLLAGIAGMSLLKGSRRQ